MAVNEASGATGRDLISIRAFGRLCPGDAAISDIDSGHGADAGEAGSSDVRALRQPAEYRPAAARHAQQPAGVILAEAGRADRPALHDGHSGGRPGVAAWRPERGPVLGAGAPDAGRAPAPVSPRARQFRARLPVLLLRPHGSARPHVLARPRPRASGPTTRAGRSLRPRDRRSLRGSGCAGGRNAGGAARRRHDHHHVRPRFTTFRWGFNLNRWLLERGYWP